ncbi:hypothetical protein O181_012779 [Austropuccinia psidii MF-1]|uniref:Uncharacterized protein n=1 Tax=Austropuccinia psidii MF-1 TaxID=1389203 RepID=A0A9Q3GN72_9BASI|nr:hypothetical protein [Austropuccinia psidii MF-1]
MNTEGVVKGIRQVSDSPPDPDAEGSDELDSEEAEVVHNSSGHQSSTSPYLPPASPSFSSTRPALILEVRPSSMHQSRSSPIVTSKQRQPVASSSRRREDLSPLPFTASQLFQKRDHWPTQVTREDPNTASDNQDAVARLFRRVDRNGREVIEYANDRNIPSNASEEMAGKYFCYEEEPINGLQRTFDHLGRDTYFPSPILCLV